MMDDKTRAQFLGELEIYADNVKRCVSSLNILRTYDPKFVFLETPLIKHMEQVEAHIIQLKGN